MNNTVIIYGGKWCQPAKPHRRLRKAGVQFRYVDVEKEPYCELGSKPPNVRGKR